jgi:hypothetical protein
MPTIIPVTDQTRDTHLQLGRRARYRVPVRGGEDLGFGEILKINRKTIRVRDDKNGTGELTVEKGLVFEVVVFS